MAEESESGRRRGLEPRAPGQPLRRATPGAYTVVILLFILFVYLVRSVLLPFIVAGAVAYVMTPLINRVHDI